LTGERKFWYQLASHLHLPLQEVQQKTTSTEFIEWKKYLKEEPNDFHREDYYLAQIAAEIRRGNIKNPRSLKLTDMLIPFVDKSSDAIQNKQRKESGARQFFGVLLGFSKRNKDGREKTNRPNS